MDKKGIVDLTREWVLWIVRAVVFFVVMSIIIIIVYIPISVEFRTDGLRHSLLRQHLLYDRNCLAYEDERVYPGVIDYNKFNKGDLEKCFSTKNYGTQIILKTNFTKTVNLNDDLIKFEFCFDKTNFYCTNATYYVLIKNSDIEQGTLNIAIFSQK